MSIAVSPACTRYQAALQRAITRTAELGVAVPTRMPVDGTWFTQELANELHRCLARHGLRLEDSAGQCLKWCHALVPILGEILGAEPLLTIGAHYHNGRPVFDPSADDIERWGRRGISAQDFAGRMGLNLHAWLTLPTGEFMDPTLMSSIAAFCDQPERAGTIVGGWLSDMDPVTHVPLAVGQAYAEALQRRTAVPLLAAALTREEMAPKMVLIAETGRQ
ncbi:hypothetical protein [Dyella sp.]|uniref:hypothetical protein n=1 Tax=Dyella sp. TaxID=1869338 RepID=UPI002D792835|nr:hypothetical protein [Dyella sp.]HET7329912.1 hypothetical protein [Dyella sp.]